MVRLGIVALIGAAALGYMTYVEGTLALQSSKEPEVMSLKKLLARGPEGNANVVVTDFVLCDNLVHQFNQSNKDVWTQVWIPIVPSDEVPPGDKGPIAPSNVKALFFSTSIHNANELETRLNKPRVQGLVTNRISSLETKIRDLLKQTYRDTDFDKCLIIQEGRAPTGMGTVLMFGAGSALCLVVAIAFFLAAWFRGPRATRGS